IHLQVKVYNSLGQEVKTLINNETYQAGTHTAKWDGTTNNGTQVASGVYLYKLFFGNFSTSKKMTLIR
ncbi:MAG: FlgD immunoglobulin-like domain containing protein, partial [Calditrichota bacterium]